VSLFVRTRLLAATFIAFSACAAFVAAQQQPAPAPPGTSGPIQPPATQQPPPPANPAPGQTPPGQTTPAPKDATQPAVPAGRVIAADAGLVFFPVKPERTADFEKIMAKLHEALAASQDPVRKEQAAGWKVFKAVEPGPNNTALYVFLIDPAVKGTDYAFWKTIYDEFPAEVQELYRLYVAASPSGQSLLNLQLVQAFGSPPAPPAAKIPD
jgi:hypothetical protein